MTGGPDATAARLRSCLRSGQAAIAVAASCRSCNAVGVLIVGVPESATMGEATCHVCDAPLLAVFGLGGRDSVDGARVHLAMLNAAAVLGQDEMTVVGVSVGVKTPDPAITRH